MNLSFRKRRWAATLMLAGIAVAYVAPAAQAAGHYRRWKPVPSYGYGVRYARPYPVRIGYYQRSSSAAPFIAGLVGGAILGTVLSQPHVHATVATTYYDPYCDITFGSLDACRAHFDRFDHPHVIRVVEGGRFTRDLCWDNGGGWRDWHGSWRGDDSYRNDGWRRYDDRDPRWKDDRSWNDRRDDGRDDRRWNDRRSDDDRPMRDREDDDRGDDDDGDQ